MNYVTYMVIDAELFFFLYRFRCISSFSSFFLFQHTYMTHTAELSVTHFNLCSFKVKVEGLIVALCSDMIRQSEQLNCNTRSTDTLRMKRKKGPTILMSVFAFLLNLCSAKNLKKALESNQYQGMATY